MTTNSILKQMLELSEKTVDMHMTTRLENLNRTTRFIGYYVTAASVTAAYGFYELFGTHRLSLVAFAMAATTQFVTAAGMAYTSTIPERIIQPGRLPSEIWDELIDPNMIEEIYINSRIMENNRSTQEAEATHRLCAVKQKWAVRLAIATIPVSCLVAWLVSYL